MKTDDATNQRIAQMSFAKVYPLYVTKVEKKGRTRAELDALAVAQDIPLHTLP